MLKANNLKVLAVSLDQTDSFMTTIEDVDARELSTVEGGALFTTGFIAVCALLYKGSYDTGVAHK